MHRLPSRKDITIATISVLLTLLLNNFIMTARVDLQAANDVGTPHLAKIGVACGGTRVGKNCGGDHAEADLEKALVRYLVVGLEPREDALVRRGVPRAAVFGRAADPAESGIEFVATPCLCLVEHVEFLLSTAFLKHVDLVGALAPDEGPLGLFALEIGIEKCSCRRGELLG